MRSTVTGELGRLEQEIVVMKTGALSEKARAQRRGPNGIARVGPLAPQEMNETAVSTSAPTAPVTHGKRKTEAMFMLTFTFTSENTESHRRRCVNRSWSSTT